MYIRTLIPDCFSVKILCERREPIVMNPRKIMEINISFNAFDNSKINFG